MRSGVRSVGSISLIRGRYRVQVRRKGQRPISKSFDLKRDAERWARQVESAMDEKRHADPGSVTFGAMLRDYRDSFTVPMGKSKASALRLLEYQLGHERAADLTAARLVRWAQERRRSPATVSMDLSYIGTVFKHARAVMGLAVHNPIPDARVAIAHRRLAGKARKRDRRPTEGEIDALCDYFDRHSALPMRDIIWFAIHSAMRLGEIMSLRWADLDRKHKTILVRDRKDPRQKHGNDQVVPLLAPAMEIIERQPRGELIFPYDGGTVSSIFPRACRKLKIRDLHFHDLRHEGTTRLFELGLSIVEVQAFTGHKQIQMLLRYTHLKASDIAAKASELSSRRDTSSGTRPSATSSRRR